jgi:hypothetical protein
MEARTIAKRHEAIQQRERALTHSLRFLSKQKRANKDNKPKTEQIEVLETQI